MTRRFLLASSVSFLSASRSISSCVTLRSTVSIGAGNESISIFNRDAASSTKSIALSGKKRSVMYRWLNVAAATMAESWMRMPW